MGKSSWKRRVKEAATTQNSDSGGATGGDGGWRYIYRNSNGSIDGDKPLQCIKDTTNQQCRCIAIEAKSRGGRRVIRLEDIRNMNDEDFQKFKTRLYSFRMDKGLCASMFHAIDVRVKDNMFSSIAETKRENKKVVQPQAKKATEDKGPLEKRETQGEEKKKKRRNKLTPEEIAAKKASEDNQETKDAQGEEKKKKRRKKPKKLTPEEIAVKVAEGMKRRAKKKPPPKKYDRRPIPIHEVPWVQKVLRRNDRPICDDVDVLNAANVAESIRPQFKNGPVTLRQFFNQCAFLRSHSEPEMSNERLLGKESPFWTKKNLRMIRGMVLAGFTFKPKEAVAVGTL